jgi:hypothetical protein
MTLPKLPEPEKYFVQTTDGFVIRYTPDSVRAIQEEAYRAGMAAAVPDGWKAVPVEPTEDMLMNVDEDVGGHCYSCTRWRASFDDCRRVWSAMLSASPEIK